MRRTLIRKPTIMAKHAVGGKMDTQDLWQKIKQPMLRLNMVFGLFSSHIVRLFTVEQDICEEL